MQGSGQQCEQSQQQGVADRTRKQRGQPRIGDQQQAAEQQADQREEGQAATSYNFV